jgi:hypothetical protein
MDLGQTASLYLSLNTTHYHGPRMDDAFPWDHVRNKDNQNCQVMKFEETPVDFRGPDT